MTRNGKTKSNGLPRNHEAEIGVIACCLSNPARCLTESVERLKAGGDEFDDLRNQTIFSAMIETMEQRKGLNIIALCDTLKARDRLEECGGLAYIVQLEDNLNSIENLPNYLDIVIEKYLFRKTIQVCETAINMVKCFEGDVTTFLDSFETDALSIRPKTKTKGKSAKELVMQAIGVIEDLHKRQGAITGLSTGLSDLDKITSGLHGGEYWVFSGLPSSGKTSLAMNIVESIALDQNLPVGVFSLEMSAEQLMLRMMCSRARVNLRNVRDGFMAERDFHRLTGVSGKLAKSLVFIEDASDLTVYQVRAAARRMKQQHGIKAVAVDYIQLLGGHGGTRKFDKRNEEVAIISNNLKQMAKELDLPVIGISQVNEFGELAESKTIGRDADVVGLLEPTEEIDPDDQEKSGYIVPMTLLIRKQRNGPAPAKVYLTFLKAFTRFESAAKVNDEDYTR